MLPETLTGRDLLPESDVCSDYEPSDSSNSLLCIDQLQPATFALLDEVANTSFYSTPADEPSTISGSSLSQFSSSADYNTPQTTVSSNSLPDTDSPQMSNSAIGLPAIYKEPGSQCINCKNVYASSNFEHHSRTCKRFRCTVEGCSKTFTLNKDLERHKTNVHEKKLSLCKRCGKKFRKDNLVRHMRTHESKHGP